MFNTIKGPTEDLEEVSSDTIYMFFCIIALQNVTMNFCFIAHRSFPNNAQGELALTVFVLRT